MGTRDRTYDRPVPEPGWYNDDDDELLARWHDGEGWTDHTIAKAEWVGLGTPPSPEGQRPLRDYQPVAARRSMPRPPPLWFPGAIALIAVVLIVIKQL
jgi:hypothetical protein